MTPEQKELYCPLCGAKLINLEGDYPEDKWCPYCQMGFVIDIGKSGINTISLRHL